MNRDLTGPAPRTSILAGLGIVATFALVVIGMIISVGVMP